MKNIIIALALLAAAAPVNAQLIDRLGDNPLGMKTYTQTVVVRYASEAAAKKGVLIKRPLPSEKTWAFSSRWDDNRGGNQRMHDIMSKYGFKGTFYLNDRKQGGKNKGKDYAFGLVKDGFSIGGHSMTHPKFNTISRSQLWREIMEIRLVRETDVDMPINSFAFPYGIFSDKNDATLHADVGEALFRAGYHHNVYGWFIKKKAGLETKAVSSVNQIIPGDHNTQIGKMDKGIETYLKNNWVRKKNPNMSVAVHVAMKGKDWDQVDACFKKYAGRKDWWYCNQNDYAAYRYEFHHTYIARKSQKGNLVRYEVTRPMPVDLGACVPLWCEAPGAVAVSGVGSSLVDGEGLEVRTAGKSFIVLAHLPSQQLPQKIDVATKDGAVEKFPDLECQLMVEEKPTWKLTLTIKNNGKKVLTSAYVILRLPLLWEAGQRNLLVSDIKPGGFFKREIDLGAVRSDERFRAGEQYFVAQLDFKQSQKQGRIYISAVVSVAPDSPPSTPVR